MIVNRYNIRSKSKNIKIIKLLNVDDNNYVFIE